MYLTSDNMELLIHVVDLTTALVMLIAVHKS
nr:MAG TPA: hypothetical protein [Caudoviricetes sp.]